MSELTPQYVMNNGVITPVQANSLSNPTITADTVRQYIINGQVFSSGTGNVTAGGTAGVCPASLFNPNNSGKTLYLISLKCVSATVSTGLPQVNATTSDPNYATVLTPVNNKLGSGITSVANCTTVNTISTLPGTLIESTAQIVNAIIEFLAVYPRIIVIPPNNGIVVGVYAGAAAKYAANFTWIEA